MKKFAALCLLFPGFVFAQSYVADAPGAVARPISEKLRETVSVKDFGARGDDVTDDTAALQAAIAAAQSSGRPLFIPAGRYSYSGLTVGGGVDIYGEGAPLYTILHYKGTGTALQLRNSGGRLRNFAIFSTGAARTALDVVNASELYVDHVQVGGSPASRFTTGVRLSQSAAVTLEHFVSSWNDVGILLDAGEWANSHISIHDGNLFEHAVAPIQIKQGTGVFIERNWIEGFQTGILVENAGGLVSANSVSVRDNSIISIRPGALALHVNTTSEQQGLFVYNFVFEGNKVSTAAGDYNVELSYARSAAGSIGDFCFRNNLSTGAVRAAVYGDSPALQIYSDNDMTDPFAAPYPVLAGVAAVTSIGAALRPALSGECSRRTAGRISYQPGGPGKKDTLRVCLKDASDGFDWVTVH